MRNGNQGAIEMSHIEKFWRNATAADVVDVMNGKEVEARFSNASSFCGGGVYGLRGWKMIGGAGRWIDDGASSWRFCQVYSPPQWFLDKPDPGEGFRLLGKFPDEALQPGDELFLETKGWVTSERASVGLCQVQSSWYRRRIEPPKPEPKHYTLQAGDTADVPSGHRLAVTEHGVEVT